jgi:anthranilate/para-aminobenzoate synthase component I
VLFGRVVDVPARPEKIARALVGRPGFFVLVSSGGGRSFLGCDPVESRSELDPEPGLVPVRIEHRDLCRAPRWIGVLPYEARRELERRFDNREPDPRPEPHLVSPRWFRYAAVVEVGPRVRVIGDDRYAVDELARRIETGYDAPLAPARLRLAEPIESADRHRARIKRALEHIAKGDVYVINLARRFRFDVDAHPLALLEALARRAPSAFSAALAIDGVGIASTSPELFLQTDPDGRIETWPIKGTRPRGRDASDDERQRTELAIDPKERAELAMVIDVERNDLGRVARPGSVRLVRPPEVETHRSVHHRVARVCAQLRPGVGRAELLEALLPSGSVTGAPKIRAMELISALEAHRRGLYTGALGFLRHDGSLLLSMAIRTLTVANGEGHYFAGGGIVADSDPERETVETEWKADQVLRAIDEN